jgi:hypothetical protein
MKNVYLVVALLLISISCSENRISEEIVSEKNLKEVELLYQDLVNSPSGAISPKLLKRNPKKLYVHYMPWFQNKETNGYWGQHWTMTNKNPDVVDEYGNRQIASHYYPLVGPYSSKDDDLQEYHLLLMKLAGIDGVIFDWYGSRDIHDFSVIKENTESFIKEIEEVGLQFAIMYEDRVAGYASAKTSTYKEQKVLGVSAVVQDMQYIESTYYTSENYIRLNGSEILFIFGPNYLTEADDWNTIFSSVNTIPKVFTLWKASNRVGNYAGGEFSWVDKGHLQTLIGYYDYVEKNNITTVGGVYGGFNDFYFEGGWNSTDIYDWIIPHQNVETFNETLGLMDKEPVEFIQLITWNDFGEGTMIEPTIEFGFHFLRELQIYTGTIFTEKDLKLAYRLYLLRKKYVNHKRLNRILDGVHKFLFTLDLHKANRLLDVLEQYFPV